MLKKILLLFTVLLSVLIAGCASENQDSIRIVDFDDTSTFKNLNQFVYPDSEFAPYDNDFKALFQVSFLNAFMNKTTKAIFVGDDNYIYSPISLYMALAMLVEGAEGKTRSELLELLDIDDLETLRSQMQAVFEHNHYANEDGVAQMANSIWIRNDFPVETAFLEVLANRYFASAYGTEFDDEGAERIIEWINTNTHDLLQLDKDNYPIEPNLSLLLLNTVYFDNKWETEFNADANYTDNFNEIIDDVLYMNHTVDSHYYAGVGYEIVFDYFKNGNSIEYILPGVETNVQNLLEEDILNMTVEEYTDVKATISVPKFKTKSSYELNDTLIALGCGRMFTPLAEFGAISSSSLMVSFVKQDAGIELSEEGVKAAAVSSIGMVTSSSGPGLHVNIVLNRPFIYVIRDSNEVPLFVGVVNDPNA